MMMFVIIDCSEYTITDGVYKQIKKCKEDKDMSETFIKVNTIEILSVYCSPTSKKD